MQPLTQNSETADERIFNVVITCAATNVKGMRTDMAVDMVEPQAMQFNLATDEGADHGGGGTAPTPLMLFAGGLTACLMTQLRAFSKRLRIDVGEMRLNTHLHWIGRQVGRAPYVTEPVGFQIDIEMNGTAEDEERITLIEAAKKGCFVEQTLIRPNAVAHRLLSTGGWIDV